MRKTRATAAFCSTSVRAAAAADFPEAVQGSCGRWRARRLVLGAVHAKLPDGAGVHQAGEQGIVRRNLGAHRREMAGIVHPPNGVRR